MLLNYSIAFDSNAPFEMMDDQNFVDEIKAEVSTMHKSFFLPFLQDLKISVNQYNGAYFYQFLV